jgi:RNA 3'-terminal phosphate cyclase-like protein
MIKRIRGIAFTTRASPSFGNRMVDDSKELLQKYVGDVFVYKDHYKGKLLK